MRVQGSAAGGRVPLPRALHLRSAGLATPATTQSSLASWALARLAPCSSRAAAATRHSAALAAADLDREECRYLAVGAGDGSLYIHDVLARAGGGAPLLHVGRSHAHCHKSAVTSVSWGGDSGLVTSCSRDGVLAVWDTNTGRAAELVQLGSRIHRHHLQPAHSLVAVGGDTSHVQLVDLRSGSRAHVLRGGHTGQVVGVAWAPGPAPLLATAGDTDRRVVVWDVRRASSCLHRLDADRVRVRRPGSRKEPQLAGWSHKAPVQGVVWTAGGRGLVSVGQDQRLRQWDAVLGLNMKTRFPSVASSSSLASVQLEVSAGCARDCVFVPESSRVSLLALDTGGRLATLSGHYGSVHCLKFNPQQLELYTGGKDKHVHIWSPESEQSQDDADDENKLTRDTWSDTESE